MPVTLRDISQIAQTSEATVSLVLNGKKYGRVSSATRRRIEKIAQDMGYEPNHQAQRLATGKAMAIGLLLNDLSNPFFANYASLLQARLSAKGYHGLPFETHGEIDREAEMIRMVDRSFCDAVVLLTHVFHRNTGLGERLPIGRIPAVVRFEHYSGIIEPDHPYCAVNVNYATGIAALIDHLADTGRQTLGMVVHRIGNHPWSEPRHMTDRARCIGREVERVGLRSDAGYVAVGSETEPLQSWYELTRQLLTDRPEIDALLVHNAQTAAPSLAAAQDAGRTVGRDLALATYDDPDYGEWLGPGLTVVREPAERIADALAERIVALINGQRPEMQTTIDTELCIRGSTRPGAGAPRAGTF